MSALVDAKKAAPAAAETVDAAETKHAGTATAAAPAEAAISDTGKNGNASSNEGALPTPPLKEATTRYPRIRDTLLVASENSFCFEEIEAELTGSGDPWDGAPLVDDPGDDVPTPPKWLASEPDNPKLARIRWRYTQMVYKRFDLNTILERPHPMFEVIQKYTKVLYLGVSRDKKSSVTLDDPTRVDWENINRLGITMEELVYHYLWYAEYQHSSRMGNTTSCISCIDVGNMDFSYLRGKKKQLGSVLPKFFEVHSPESNLTTFITNTPGWFNWMVWPLIKLTLNKRVQAKLNIVPSPKTDKKYKEKLAKLVDMACIPKEIGGESEDPWNNHYQRGMHEMAAEACAKAGIKMLTEDDVLRMRAEIASKSSSGESKN